MNETQFSSTRMAAVRRPIVATRLNIRIGMLACVLALAGAAPAAAAQEHAPVHPNSIKRYMFSTETFAAVEVEFAKLEVVLTAAPKAPAAGGTTWTTGTGASGFSTPFAIDHVGGRFHVYAERRRPSIPSHRSRT